MRASVAAALMLCGIGAAQSAERLPTIPPADYTPEQRQAVAEFEAARKSPPFGPFQPMLHSPNAMSLARAMGDYFRYHSTLGNTLSELAILMTAYEWHQGYEWSVHYPIAVKAGVRQSLADAIAQGRRPKEMSVDEEMIYTFVRELLKNKQVSDPSFDRVKARFGTQGVVDLTGVVGYYSFLAMQLNVARFPAPADGAHLPAAH